MSKITPCLWFDGNAEEAASFYVGLLPDSGIDQVHLAPVDYPSGQKGDVLMVTFRLAGQSFLALNGGPEFKFDEAVSFIINTDDQAETDRLWNALIADGGAPVQCGWLKDRFGLSWQITPKRLMALMADPDPVRAKRAMESMMQMVNIDIAELERAVEGT